MQKTHLVSKKSLACISLPDLARNAEGWILDGEIRQLSTGTLYLRRLLVEKLLWFFREKKVDSIGTVELRMFLAYIGNGHTQPNGRWGNARHTKPVKPRTVQLYHDNLKTLFRFLVEEGVLDSSPAEILQAPIVRADQIQPFNSNQIDAFLRAAKKSRHPRRDEAIVLLLLDTGMRATELVSLCRKDLDFQGKRITVLGKGNKTRSVYFSPTTARSLWNYLKEDPREDADPLFQADRGMNAGRHLTRNGLLQLIERIGKAAHIEAMRCSPHTFRHTFAIEYLRSGGNVFALQQLLGHTSLHVTNRYIALAQADLAAQHGLHSPVERLRRKAK